MVTSSTLLFMLVLLIVVSAMSQHHSVATQHFDWPPELNRDVFEQSLRIGEYLPQQKKDQWEKIKADLLDLKMRYRTELNLMGGRGAGQRAPYIDFSRTPSGRRDEYPSAFGRQGWTFDEINKALFVYPSYKRDDVALMRNINRYQPDLLKQFFKDTAIGIHVDPTTQKIVFFLNPYEDDGKNFNYSYTPGDFNLTNLGTDRDR